MYIKRKLFGSIRTTKLAESCDRRSDQTESSSFHHLYASVPICTGSCNMKLFTGGTGGIRTVKFPLLIFITFIGIIILAEIFHAGCLHKLMNLGEVLFLIFSNSV